MDAWAQYLFFSNIALKQGLSRLLVLGISLHFASEMSALVHPLEVFALNPLFTMNIWILVSK